MIASSFIQAHSRAALGLFRKHQRLLSHSSTITYLLAVLLVCAMCPIRGQAQGTDTALLRGTVKDPSGAVIPAAKVTATAVATRVQTSTQTDSAGAYIFQYLKPGTYNIKVEKAGFKTWVFPGVLLRLGAQTNEDATLQVGSTQQTVEVKSVSPLLNTVSAALGTTVSNEYIMALPLLNRNIYKLSMLSGGVSQVSGAAVGQYEGGTVFASNGQRFATADFRVDGVLASRPEAGEGGSTTVSYMPSVDDLQEFRLQNNNMSAEYGNNGGTVVNIVTKGGENQFHGSGYWFFRRPSFDAVDFFTNRAGGHYGTYAHDQYGGSIGGPIKRDKTFFFFDYEGFRDNSPATLTTTVPTDLQRQGDFSKTYNADGSLQQIYNPFQVSCAPLSGGGQDCERQPFQGNVIPSTMFDSIGKKLINLYPEPNTPGIGAANLYNYETNWVSSNPRWQSDIRIDQNFSRSNRLTGRFSVSHRTHDTPDPFLEPSHAISDTHDVSLEDTWTLSPTLLWVNRVGVLRANYHQTVKNVVDPSTLGFPSYLISNAWYGEPHMPGISVSGYQGLANDQCCTDTVSANTQWMVNSIMTKMIGGHSIKFGAEWRDFLNAFFQPSNTSGSFEFAPDQTMQSVFSPDQNQGNALASMLLGFLDTSGNNGLGFLPAVMNKSSEGALFVQDDWRATSRLTVDAGLRWEWSIPYEERFNRNQFSCFNCSSGITVPGVPGYWAGGLIYGTTVLAGPGHRHANSDMNDVGPRLGLAYRLAKNTVIHAGGGFYYGTNFATNWQYGGSAWQGGSSMNTSLDGGITQYATMENPFPDGILFPQAGKYGSLTLWGESNYNHGSDTYRTPNIYQWNFGVQHQWGNMMVEADYVGNRSVHLPWNYQTEQRNRISPANRENYGHAGLHQNVTNPFQYLFVGPQAMFDVPGSVYNNATVPLIDILRPYPQFPGSFAGFPMFAASGTYHALQVRFEKRASHGLAFVGNYTWSKFIDDSDSGANAWIGSFSSYDRPQDLYNLAAEKSLSGNDAPQRLTFAVIYDLPVGRGERFASHMNKVLDGVIGGWRVTPFVSFQSGNPIHVRDGQNLLDDGSQRPNLIGNPCSGASLDAIVSGTAKYFNLNSFSHPGDEVPGTAPRYLNCRAPGIRNIDLSVGKRYQITESKYVEVRGDFFNAFNTPRFAAPYNKYGSSNFGTIRSQVNSARQGQIGIRFVF